MISHKYKCIFLHIPKTGGGSVEKLFTGGHIPCREIITELGFTETRHSKPDQLFALNTNFSEIWDKYRKFTFVRNPWERLWSYWKFHKNHAGLIPKFVGTFKDFILRLDPSIPPNFPRASGLEYPECTKAPPPMMLDWISVGGVVDPSIEVLRFEKYTSDLSKFLNSSKFTKKLLLKTLPHTHRTDKIDYTTKYGPVMRDRVAEIYTKDIEYFGYEFGE
jgi:hypothetical protein